MPPPNTKDALRGTLEEAGFYTTGFTGGSAQDYQEWYTESFGVDPFEMAVETGQAVTGKQGRAGRRALQDFDVFEGDVLENIAALGEFGGAGYDPTTGMFTGAPEPGQEALHEYYGTVAAEREERREFAAGESMLQWLMSQSAIMDPEMFERVAPIVSQGAAAKMAREIETPSTAGIFGQRYAGEMQEEARRAGGFDFFRDLLPSLIQIGGAGMGGGGRRGGGSQQLPLGTGPETPMFDITPRR